MKKSRKHKVWQSIGLLLGVFALISLPACAWIEEFDSRYDIKIEETKATYVRIAWINSYSEDTLWSIRMQTGMLETLARNGYSRPLDNLEWRSFHLNAKGDESFALLRYRVQDMIPDVIAYEPDIIIVSDDEAAMTLGPLYPNRDIPIVYCGMTTEFQVSGLDLPNIVGVTEPLFAEETLAIARSMVPVNTRILIIADASMTGKATANSILAQIAGARTELQAPVMELVRDWEAWQQSITDYATDVDLIFIASYNPLPDRDSELVSEPDMLQWTVENSLAPVFAFTQTAIANGAVAGLVTDAYNQGRYAAEIAAYLANNGEITMVDSALSIEYTNRLVLNLAAAEHWSLEVPVILPIVADVYDNVQLGGGE